MPLLRGALVSRRAHTTAEGSRGPIILCGGACPVRCRVLSSTLGPGPWPLVPDFPECPLGAPSPLVEKHRCGWESDAGAGRGELRCLPGPGEPCGFSRQTQSEVKTSVQGFGIP